VAERAWPMKAAMGPLAVLSIVGGYLVVPGVTDVIDKFLEPTFDDSRFRDTAPTHGAEVLGLVVGGLIAIAGIGLAWLVYRRRPGTTARLVERFPRAYDFLSHKWYFDELYDAAFVRPAAAMGGFGRRVIETEFVQGTIVGGATGIVRVSASVARAIQTGYLRAYALLLLVGVAGLTLYFLVNSST
jgi:NADH-quinone oxidoreductase subunit L